MPFRGVDPDGLTELATAVEAAGGRVRHAVLPALAVLDSNGHTLAAAELARSGSRTGMWANDAADALRWRSQVISSGQNSRFDVSALLRARFAREAVFTMSTLETTYRHWIGDQLAEQQEITDAVAAISRWLSQGLTDWDVSNNDLHNIRLTLESLTGAQLNRVLKTLTPRQIERWVTEMGHSINGFSRDEKREVFALLAADASGDSLEKVHDAILKAAGVEELADFGEAIRAHSADQAIVEFVGFVAAQDLSPQFSALAPALAMTGLDERAAATAATSIVASSDDALEAMAIDCVLYQPAETRFGEWLSVLNRTTNGDDRAAAFATFAGLALNHGGVLGELIGERGRNDPGDYQTRRRPDGRSIAEERQHLLSAATQLLKTDPGATITALAKDLDTSGDLTASYWQLMVEDGRAESIGSILEALRGGEEINIETFSITGADADYRYPHARNLAFAAATLNRGFSGAAAAANGDIDTIVRVTGIATAVLGLVTKGADLITSLVGVSLDLGVAAHGEAVKEDIAVQLETLIDTVSHQLRPTDERLPNPPTGLSGALTAWTNMYLQLLPGA
ncbi:MAG: hypothetical protein GY722_25975 [bacterium]|nr:hypothetical protein [bacterium]